MAYVPPHKRHGNGPSPTPPSLAQLFKKSLSLRSPKADGNKHSEIIYDDRAVNEWLSIGSGADRNLISSTEYGEAAEGSLEPPWSSLAKLVFPHLISTFKVLKSVDAVADDVEVKPCMVARFGQILSRGMGLEPGEEKVFYRVKITDKLRPNEIISCKCRLAKDDHKLEVYKVVLNIVRHMVFDISSLEKDLDLRLMLSAKRTVKAFINFSYECQEEERSAITDLVGSAIIDGDVKGGLRWPLGKNSSGCDRFHVAGAWHLYEKCYRDSSFKLNVDQADRFDFRASTGEVQEEVNLKMVKMVCLLGEPSPDSKSIREMLEESLKLIWENFLPPVLRKVDSKSPLLLGFLFAKN